ncbi:suppressor protein SRP40-like isoform X3, partial [Lates japonicus]
MMNGRRWRVYKPCLGLSCTITEQQTTSREKPGDKLKERERAPRSVPAPAAEASSTCKQDTRNCDTMKVAVVFILLFATVLCRPARKVSDSSSESSEEVVRRPAPQAIRKQAAAVPQTRAAAVQNVVAAAAAGSDESKESSDEEEEQTAAQAPAQEVRSDSADTASATASTSDTASVSSDDSDDDDDDAEESETEEDEDESSDSSESGESSTLAPTTVSPVIVTEEPVIETTAAPIEPTIVTDTETARGDNMGGYPSDYKSIVYVEDKSYHKVPGPYKSYEFVGTGKKMAYDMTDGNEVEKSLKVYKALQVHSDILEEDTSTPDVESQGLDASSGTSQDLSPRQASLPEEEESASTSEASASDATTSESESSSAT